MLCPLADTGRSHLPRPPVCRRSSPRRTPEPSIDLKHGRSDQLPSARTTRSGTLLRRKSVNVSLHERRLFRSAGRAGRQVWHPETLATKALFRTPSYLRRAYNPDRRSCLVNVSSDLQHALSRRAAQRPVSDQRGDVPHSFRTARSGASHPAALLSMMFGKYKELIKQWQRIRVH